MDLFHTLRVYLENNGSIKETSEELYIHRSSLLYRLEKITDLLDVDINDSEYRFSLMMAYKLYDLNIGKVGPYLINRDYLTENMKMASILDSSDY